MEDEHREAIRRNISSLVNQTDLEIMRSALYEKGVFTEHNMETYNDTSSTPMHRKRCMYNDIMRRGPRAFETLLETLEENGYWDLVRMLDPNSILNTSGSPSTRPHITEKRNNFVSLSNKKSESELLNSHPAPSNGVDTAAANNDLKVPFVVKKSTKFVDDNLKNDIGVYRTRGRRRGVLLVFTYISFQNNIEQYRAGAEVDSRNLEYLFFEIGFKVLLYQNLTLQETHSTLEKLKDALEPAPESVFIVVSSHGYERRGMYDTDIRCSDGKLISLMEIISYFSNRQLPRLRDVPKVFIFQICRGSVEDFVHSAAPPRLREPAETDGTPLPPDAAAREPHAPRPDDYKKMSLYNNILLVQSTLPGSYSTHSSTTHRTRPDETLPLTRIQDFHQCYSLYKRIYFGFMYDCLARLTADGF